MADSRVMAVMKKHGVRKVYKKPRKLSGGDYSNVFYDVLKTYKNLRDFHLLVKKLYEKIGVEASAVASCGGGLKLAEAMAKKYKMELVRLEKHDEEGYTRKPSSGYTPSPSEKVIIVDDVFTKGGTLKKMWMDLAPTGCNVVGFGVVINRGDRNAWLYGKKLIYLINAEDLDSAH